MMILPKALTEENVERVLWKIFKNFVTYLANDASHEHDSEDESDFHFLYGIRN
jgi:hypothetical protein